MMSFVGLGIGASYLRVGEADTNNDDWTCTWPKLVVLSVSFPPPHVRHHFSGAG